MWCQIWYSFAWYSELHPFFHNMVRTMKDNKQTVQLPDTMFEAQYTLVKLKWILFLVLEVETHAYFVFKVFNFSRNMNIGSRNNLFRLNWASLLLFFEYMMLLNCRGWNFQHKHFVTWNAACFYHLQRIILPWEIKRHKHWLLIKM